MSGQVIPRGDRKWLVRWYVGRDGNGKRVYNSETVNGTHAQAQQVLRKKLTAKDTGTLTATTKLLLKDYLDAWLKGKQKIGPKTLRDYQQRLDLDVLPALGHCRLDKLTPLACKDLVASLVAQGKSPRTIQYTISVLSQALSHAVRDGMIPRNPCEFLELPTVTRSEKTVLSVEEQQRLLSCGDLPVSRLAMWYVALTTGLRPQEYLAIKWDDVSMTDRSITVRRALVEVTPGHWAIGKTKTHGSIRVVPVPSETIEALKAHRVVQAATILKAGDAYDRSLDLVFAGRTGHPLDLVTVRKRWKADCQTAGVPPTRLYDTRHTHFTTFLGAGGHPKVAQERAGHSSYRTTMDIYSHVMPSMQEEAAEIIGSVLFPPVANTGTSSK